MRLMGRGAIARQLRLRVERCDHRRDADGEELSMVWCGQCRKLAAAAEVLERQLMLARYPLPVSREDFMAGIDTSDPPDRPF